MFGLLEQLEEMQTEQELCRKSLADFMDGKRRTFPRFYFTSEADLLDILSNGSKPRRILRHVSSVMLATKTLELEGGESRAWNVEYSRVESQMLSALINFGQLNSEFGYL